jgi:hypothetical protein
MHWKGFRKLFTGRKHADIKIETVPVTARGEAWVCETPRLQHSLGSRLIGGGGVVNLTCLPQFTSQGDSWYSFLLKVESTPGPWCGWYSNHLFLCSLCVLVLYISCSVLLWIPLRSVIADIIVNRHPHLPVSPLQWMFTVHCNDMC